MHMYTFMYTYHGGPSHVHGERCEYSNVFTTEISKLPSRIHRKRDGDDKR